MIEEGNLAVAGEDIEAGSGVMLALNEKVYSTWNVGQAGVYIGDAVERIREGFRISVKDGLIREDDA